MQDRPGYPPVVDEAARGAARGRLGAPATAWIVTLRDIARGEEIVHPYVDASEPRRLRQEGLAIYGIDCTCVRCAR